MKLVKVKRDGELNLPQELAKYVLRGDRFVGVGDRDTLILRKIHRPTISEKTLGPKESMDFMSLDEVAEEVHKHRKEKGKNK